ncbi:MAG: hypothetical protein J6L88_03500 [Clostridia bacterium]|nr:hypothetical protein [Clostridia bacterium]
MPFALLLCANLPPGRFIRHRRRSPPSPCKLGKEPENKCICEEFKAQIADPDFEGYCHCMLYYKSKD